MSYENWYKHGSALLTELRATKTPPECAAIWFFGQASVAVKAGGVTVYIDPYFNEAKNADGVSRRRFPPPFAPSEVDNADYVLCTHDHSDHLDLFSLKAIAEASPDARFIVPAPHLGRLTGAGIAEERVIRAYDERPIELEKGNEKGRVIPNGCPHDTFETDSEGNHLHMGYTLELGGVTLFHSGDSVEWPGMRELIKSRRADIALLPINGSDWTRKSRGVIGNLNAREAADVGSAADIVIPLHFDMFSGNGENPAHFVDYMYHGHPGKKFHVMTPGERFIYRR